MFIPIAYLFSQIEHLLAKISKNVRPKTVLGRTINGDMFCSLLDSYVEAMNSGGAPEIKSAWSRVVSNQCAEVKTQALDIYNSEMLSAFQSISGTKKKQPGVALQALLPINPQQLVDSHEKAKAECKKFFRSKVRNLGGRVCYFVVVALFVLVAHVIVMYYDCIVNGS